MKSACDADRQTTRRAVGLRPVRRCRRRARTSGAEMVSETESIDHVRAKNGVGILTGIRNAGFTLGASGLTDVFQDSRWWARSRIAAAWTASPTSPSMRSGRAWANAFASVQLQ